MPSYSECIKFDGERPDNKTVLDLEDDAAYIAFGGNWRMPTKEEWQELIDNCNVEWTTLNNVVGRKFTSRKPGYTEKWIFLPASGYRDGNNGATDVRYAGSSGYYWSASSSGNNVAFDLHFNNVNVLPNHNNARLRTQSVRLVTEVK